MNEILFIRHAETDMAGTFCGHSDPELNQSGHAQVAELVDRLYTENIDVIYTSDLRRAFMTATAVANAFAADLHVRSFLREINFGRWEALSWNEIQQRDKSYAHRWMAEYPRLPAPDGEDVLKFRQRVLDGVSLLSTEAEARDQRIAVVTHAGVMRTVMSALQGCSEGEAWERTRSYCSIVRHPLVSLASRQRAEVEL